MKNANVMNTKAIAQNFMINTKLALQNTRQLAMKRNDNRIIFNIVVNAYGVEVTTSPMGENKGVRIGAFKSEEDITVVTGNSVKRIVKGKSLALFTKTCISIMFENTEKIHQYMDGGIYINYKGSDTKFYYMDGDILRNLTTDDVADTEEILNEEGTLLESVRWYRDPGYTPSQKRKVQAILFDVTDGVEEVGRMLDAATSGAYGIMEGNSMNLIQMIKCTARMFQWMAPSKEIGKIASYAIYNGDWKDAAGDKLWDGMSFISATFYAACIAKILGVSVNPEAVIGEIVQNRPVTAKQLSVVTEDLFIDIMMGMVESVHYRREDITPAIAQLIIDGGKGKGPLANKMIVIGDSATPELLMDRNAIKADFDFTRIATLDVLDIAKASKARTSMQMLNKLIEKDRNGGLRLLKAICDENILKDLTTTVLDRKPRVPSIKEFQSDRMWLTNVVSYIAPTYATTKDKSMFRNLVDNMVKGYFKAINKIKFELDGANLRLISDPGQLLGASNLLKFGEVFSKEAERFFKGKQLPQSEWKVTVFKYPTIGVEECYTATVVSGREIKNRIRDLKASKQVKIALTGFFLKMSNSAVCVPAIEDLKNLLAGMDFDYDGATLVFDEEFNRIMHTDIRPVIIKIMDDKKPVVKRSTLGMTLAEKLTQQKAFIENGSMNKTFAFNTSNFIDPFIKEMLNGNKSIGDVTNTNEIQIALSRDPKKALQILRKAFGEGSKDMYIGLMPAIHLIDGQEVDVYVVTPATIDQIIEEIKTVKYTDANIKKIFADINMIFRFYQEKIIDAAKTGEEIEIKIEIGRLTWAMSLTKMVGGINWAGGEFIAELDSSIHAKKDTFQDLFYKVKAKVLNELREVMNTHVCTAEQSFSTTELAMFQQYAHASHKGLIDSMYMLKLLYNDLVGGHTERMAGASEDEQNDYKSEFRADMEVLTAFARRLTSKYSPVERARIAKYVSMVSLMNSNGKRVLNLRADGGSQFAALLLPEEYLLMINSDFAEVTFAGEPLLVGNTYKAGDMVAFTHGIAANDVVAADLNGVFEIKEFDGRLYATKEIVDLVTIPEPEMVAPIKLKDSSIDGRVDEVMSLLSNSAEVLIYARTTKQGSAKVNDYALYVQEGDQLVKVADIDTRGALYNQMIDGAKGKVMKISRNKVEGFKAEKAKDSLIVMIHDLVLVDANPEIDHEPSLETFGGFEIIESDDL